jgi:hypothetical protein
LATFVAPSTRRRRSSSLSPTGDGAGRCRHTVVLAREVLSCSRVYVCHPRVLSRSGP